MMIRPKNLLQQQNGAYVAAAVIGLIFLLHLVGKTFLYSSSSSTSIGNGELHATSAKPVKEYAVHVHATDVFVPAALYSGPLKKPLEVVGSLVSCPERGGKNTQCGKVSSEYRFKVKAPGDYFLYVQVTAPGLNDNSLWIGLVDGADVGAFDECKNPSGESSGPLIPHKHLTSSKKFLCCPAYLAKNKKKGLTGFYSDCCYSGLGKEGNERGCVLDLEVDENLRWNELPRIIRTSESDAIVTIRIYAREDGTSWGGVVLSSKSALDADDLDNLKKSTA